MSKGLVYPNEETRLSTSLGVNSDRAGAVRAQRESEVERVDRRASLGQARSVLNWIAHSSLNLFFPKFCLGCAIEGSYLCQSCQNKIITIKHQTCPACKIMTPRGAWCTSHNKDQALSSIMALGYYHDPILREAIHFIKYRRIDELIKVLAQLAAPHFSTLIPHSKVIIIPVPLHPRRQRYRDFNQAALLADELAGRWQLAYLENHLIRGRNTPPQADLTYNQRLTNVRDSFAWQGDFQVIKNKTIWLIDDVATTGATLEEGAKVLKKRGAKSIWGVVLAKG